MPVVGLVEKVDQTTEGRSSSLSPCTTRSASKEKRTAQTRARSPATMNVTAFEWYSSRLKLSALSDLDSILDQRSECAGSRASLLSMRL